MNHQRPSPGYRRVATLLASGVVLAGLITAGLYFTNTIDSEAASTTAGLLTGLTIGIPLIFIVERFETFAQRRLNG